MAEMLKLRTCLAVPDPDRKIRGWGRGGWSSRPLAKWGRGCWSLKKFFFRPFGPQFGPKIRGAPLLDPPLLGICKSRWRCFLRRETLFHLISLYPSVGTRRHTVRGWTSVSSRAGRSIPLCASCYTEKNRETLRPYEPCIFVRL